MLKKLHRPTLWKRPWICPRCLDLNGRPARSAATAAAAKTVASPWTGGSPVEHSSPDAAQDDRTIRQIFDSQPFWREFSQQTRHQLSGKRAGLFQNRYLTRPDGFQTFASVSLAKCKRIVDKVLAARTVEEYKAVTVDLDLLSDLLCRVIDLADFVRATHPDHAAQHAASRAYARMFEYMNVLNTTTGLNEQLKRALAMPEVSGSWNDEERVVAGILEKDFAKSAIDLPERTREEFVALSNEISVTGAAFVDEMQPQRLSLDFASIRMKGMRPSTLKSVTTWGIARIPTIGTVPLKAMRQVEDSDVRREIYTAQRTASYRSIRNLEKLLRDRAQLADLSGYETFGHLALSDKMAQTPEAVTEFLSALAADNQPRLQAELAELLELKKSDARSDNFPNRLNVWDREYYTARLLSSMGRQVEDKNHLAAYFSLGTVMQGLSRLFHRLFGVRLVPRGIAPGETWHDEVRRLDVVDERDGRIAVVYCDLFARAGKSPNPAHFTLRCSRRITPQELAEPDVEDSTLDPIDAATDGMASARNPSDGHLYQLPTIALICDFARSQSPLETRTQPTLLTFRDVQTVFHEMGHALHSILGRTALQNVAGTRCATDFAELPSVLMEHFASAPEVLALYARHWETDAPVPPQRVAARVGRNRRLHAAETESQILLALLDQRLHAVRARDAGRLDSTAVFHEVYDQHASLSEPAGTSWQGLFGHLFGYGATYYSYLFDRAIAGRIWREIFQKGGPGAGGAVDRNAGEQFREEVLRWGGSRDGWRCIAGLLGDEKLADGGPAAMKKVGRWGVND